ITAKFTPRFPAAFRARLPARRGTCWGIKMRPQNCNTSAADSSSPSVTSELFRHFKRPKNRNTKLRAMKTKTFDMKDDGQSARSVLECGGPPCTLDALSARRRSEESQRDSDPKPR